MQAKITRLQNIHMLCCSNECEVLDISQPVVDDLLDLELHGITAYDAHLQEDMLVVAPLMCVLCDNPQHSEIMNQSGPSANLFCRICMVLVILHSPKKIIYTTIWY